MFGFHWIKSRLGICLFSLALLATLSSGCSPKLTVINMMGNALSESGEGFASDDDPDLIKDATPFSLKLMESLLEASPKHKGLLKMTCKSFTQYAYAYLQNEADYCEDQDFAKAQFLRGRAKRMYVRSLGYGLRGLDLRVKDFKDHLKSEPEKTLARLNKKDVERLYWTGLTWMAAINMSKDDMAMIGELPLAEKCIARAYELDPDWGEGSIHEFYVTYDSRSSAMGGSIERVKAHYARALELSKGKRASTYLAYAEAVCVAEQDRKGFDELIDKALAIDPNEDKSSRLLTLVYQKRARWLQTQASKFFAE
jgi:predicted anti-sigma-YlaC factor YlaD